MKKTVVVLLALVALLAVSVVPAMAQGNEPPITPQPFGNAWRGMGPHMMDSAGPLHDAMLAAWADVLDMSVDELEARLASGETMYTIAAEAGYDGQEFYGLMLQVRAVALQQAVENGLISQEQADWMLSRAGRGMGTASGPCWMDDGTGTAQPQGNFYGRGRGMMGRSFGNGARP